MTTNRTKTFLLVLLLGASTQTWAHAQQKEEDPDSGPAARAVKRPPPDELGGDAGITEELLEDDVLANNTGKSETSSPAIANDLSFHMAPVLSFQPRRIAPGATGDAHLVLSMQRGSVLAVGSHFELDYPREQNSITLGEWTLGDPAVGVERGAFKGRPVYENYAQATIPILVGPDTPHGTYTIRMTIVADITDGASGNLVRLAQTQARAQLVVGPPLPTPAAPATGARPRAGAVSGPSRPDQDGPTGEPESAPESSAREPIRAARSVPSDRPVDPSGGADDLGAGLPVERGGGGSMLWIGLGGGFVALFALLLMLRKR